MKKLLFPAVAIVASFVYLFELIIIFIKRTDLIGIYFSSAEGFLFVAMMFASLIFYFLTQNTPVLIQNRSMFSKIFLQLLTIFIILFFPIAYYDITSSSWFSGLGTIILSMIGGLLIIIFSIIGYFLQRNQAEVTNRIKILNFFHILLSLGILVWFTITLTEELSPLQHWADYNVQVEVKY